MEQLILLCGKLVIEQLPIQLVIEWLSLLYGKLVIEQFLLLCGKLVI